VDAEYAPGGRDRLLDDFEPAYAVYAMLDLQPDEDSLQGRLRLLQQVESHVVLPIEQMGCDVIDIGLALAALFEGLDRGLVPLEDVPAFLREGPHLGRLEPVVLSVEALRGGQAAPGLRAVGDGPQALAKRYPGLADILFTSGDGTLGNAGHANALWTFLMPLSRFFGHYVGQFYKIEGDLPANLGLDNMVPVFERVVHEALQREYMSCLGNALSTCAFTFTIFSQDGKGLRLDDTDLLVRTLACYGIDVRCDDLEWFAESFWARSMAFKIAQGWSPPVAGDYPGRVFEILGQSLDWPQTQLRLLMDRLIEEWKRQARNVLYKYDHDAAADRLV
jgi:aldehyde:ferredoxin oxidoreductase